MYFWLFLTKIVGVNENLEGWEAPEGGLEGDKSPDKLSTEFWLNIALAGLHGSNIMMRWNTGACMEWSRGGWGYYEQSLWTPNHFCTYNIYDSATDRNKYRMFTFQTHHPSLVGLSYVTVCCVIVFIIAISIGLGMWLNRHELPSIILLFMKMFNKHLFFLNSNWL